MRRRWGEGHFYFLLVKELAQVVSIYFHPLTTSETLFFPSILFIMMTFQIIWWDFRKIIAEIIRAMLAAEENELIMLS